MTTARTAPRPWPVPVSGRGGTASRGRDHRDGYDHLAPKLAEYAATAPGDPRRRVLREELATAFWPLVVNIARRYRDRGEPLVDLEQTGAIGLLGALERFEPDCGSDFLRFAIPTITGEIRRHFRDRTWSMRVPRRLKDLQSPIRTAVAELTTPLCRAPRPSEIAAHTGITVEEVLEALSAQQAYRADSLDALVGHQGTHAAARGAALGGPDPALMIAAHRQELGRALAELPDRERAIVTRRFFDDRTQTQIAAEFGISQMHVSRLLSRTLGALRTRLDVPDQTGRS